jgi:hypothetical protein
MLAAAAAAASASAAALASGCGASRQDKHEPNGSFAVKVLSAHFARSQSIAKPETFELRVQNTGTRTLPNIAITLDSFAYTSNYPKLAVAKRPVWAIEEGPGGQPAAPVQSQEISPPGNGQTAYLSTWALGPLGPEAAETFEWHVIPVKAGTYTVHYTVAAGLAGKAKAVLQSEAAVTGGLTATIAPAPPLVHVNPKTGKVETGQFPKSP